MNIFEKKIDEEWKKFQEKKKNELYPNIMLIGVSGAGKSSLVNKIFGENYASVSDIKPETSGYENIYMGRECGNTVNLIDTAGYELGKGENDYYNEIHRVISCGIKGDPIHIIWYCIPITNERVQDMDIYILSRLLKEDKIRRRICVVFTKCDQDSEDSDKARTLRQAINANLHDKVRYFETSADQGLQLQLKELLEWSANAIDDEDLRNKFISAQMVDLDAKQKAAQQIITAATVAAMGIGAVPIPFSDSVLLVPVQVGMIGKIIDVYGISNLTNISTAVISDVIITNLGRSLATNLAKMLPIVGKFVGGVINAGIASTLTGAVGFATSKICYENIKKYLTGQPVVWDQMFASEEFSQMISQKLKELKK